MERYHIFKLGLAILFYAAYCIRPMLVDGLRTKKSSDVKPEDLIFYQVKDGIPGVDFPILSTIPRTSFSCQNIDSGYYADLDAECQVFHICEEGKKISFLCPNGTIFDQSDLICEWWFKVNCTNSPNLYEESVEQLRQDSARRKASRKVLLNGHETNHGAIMRVEESSSVSRSRSGKSQAVRTGTSNSITSNGNGQSKPGSRVRDRNGGQGDQQKPKRYNDADTGNYLNRIDGGSAKQSGNQFTDTSPALVTASSERHVQIRSTTPLPLNSLSPSQGSSKNRGSVKYRYSGNDVLPDSSDTPTDKYDLEFPKHKSESANDLLKPKASALGTDPKIITDTRTKVNGNSNVSRESAEVQVTQETAAFAKNSHNTLQPFASKLSTANPYPNHRTTYSDLKAIKFSSAPRFIGSINSVTPQYITTQSINSGKPFIGSMIGLNIFGNKQPSSTPAVELGTRSHEASTVGNYFSSSTQPISSSFESTTISSVSSSTTPSPLERTTKSLDQATVYGSFSKSVPTSPTPSNGVQIKFGKNVDKVSVQLSKSVGGETPKYGSVVKPPLLKAGAVIHVSDVEGTTKTSPTASNSSIAIVETVASTKPAVNGFDSDTYVPSGALVDSSTPNSISLNTVESQTFGEKFTTPKYESSIISSTTPAYGVSSSTIKINLKNGKPFGISESFTEDSRLPDFVEGITILKSVEGKANFGNQINPVAGVSTAGVKISAGSPFKPSGSGVTTESNIRTTAKYLDSTTPLPNFPVSTFAKGFEPSKYGSTVRTPAHTDDYLKKGKSTESTANIPASSHESGGKSPHYDNGYIYEVFNDRENNTVQAKPIITNQGTDETIQGTQHSTERHPITVTDQSLTNGSSGSLANIQFVGTSSMAAPYNGLPKYGSAVNPPLLKPDAVVHVSDLQSTFKPIDDTSESTTQTAVTSANRYLPKGTSVAPGGNIDAAPLPTPVPISFSTLEPITSTDALIETKVKSGFTFGDKVRSTFVSETSSTPLPNLKSIVKGVSSERPYEIAKEPSVNDRPTTVSIIESASIVSSTIPPQNDKSLGFFVTKNSVYDSSTPSSQTDYKESIAGVNVDPQSGQGELKPLTTLSAPKVETIFNREVPLDKSETQWRPRPFQNVNSLSSNKERATYLPTDSTTPTYLSYKISSARPFEPPSNKPASTVPSPFTASTPSIYENIDNMINILKEIVNASDQDYAFKTPRPGLVVPPSAGPQTLHTLAVYFANALDGIAAERDEELDDDSKEKLTSLLTQMTMYRYNELFKEGDGGEGTTVATDIEGNDEENIIPTPGLRQLARNFSLALSSYLDDPQSFKKDLESLRPTEPPILDRDATEAAVGDEEILRFSDDSKPSIQPVVPTLPSVSPTWGYILAPKSSNDLEVKNSLNPDLHTSDTQSFVPGFNNLPVTGKDVAEDKAGLPEDHWTASPGATKLWKSAVSVNPSVVNDHLVTTAEPIPDETESTESYAIGPDLPLIDTPHREIQYDLRALPKVSVNQNEVSGILIDFINTTHSDESNRLRRILKKLNTTEGEFLNRMKEIESNPLTKRLILLLISECGVNATKDLDDTPKETLESAPSNPTGSTYREAAGEGKQSSPLRELVDPNLDENDEDTRALQLLNALYSIAGKFGK